MFFVSIFSGRIWHQKIFFRLRVTRPTHRWDDGWIHSLPQGYLRVNVFNEPDWISKSEKQSERINKNFDIIHERVSVESNGYWIS